MVKKPEVKKLATKNVPAKVEEQSSALVLVQDEVPDYINQDSQRGSENVGTDDIVIPRLEIVQALSPQVKEGDPKFNDDARPGMLCNSVTGQLYGKEVMVVPVYYSKQWLAWKKRKDENNKPLEGGFLGAFNTPMDAEKRMEEEAANGTKPSHMEVIDTPQHLCLLIDTSNGRVDEVMISMPRTKAKISRQWNSMVRLAGGDRFARVYRIGTQMEKNARGDFYNFVVSQSGFPARPIYDRAEKLYTQISSGQRRVVMDVEDYETGGEGHTVDGDPEM